MSVLGWKWTFMKIILVRAREYRITTNFPKIPLCCPFIGLQVKSVFSLYFFDREEQSKKYFLHYKPCLMTSLSSRKSWDIFTLSIEKIDFLIFSYFNLRAHLSALIHKQGYIRSRNCNFFWILHSWINNPTLALFWFRPYFEKFFTLKLNVLKNAFGTRTLKPYRTVNTHP